MVICLLSSRKGDIIQTFLPKPDFAETAQVLDRQRLNKQALEAWQIMLTNLKLDPEGNHREPKGWYNHPAALMWRGHEMALLEYIRAMVSEWILRGYKSTILDKAEATMVTAIDRGLVVYPCADMPAWYKVPRTRNAITKSHRIALLSKNYEWYSQFGWREDTGTAPESYEYVWRKA
jgi:hypothetical protein